MIPAEEAAIRADERSRLGRDVVDADEADKVRRTLIEARGIEEVLRMNAETRARADAQAARKIAERDAARAAARAAGAPDPTSGRVEASGGAVKIAADYVRKFATHADGPTLRRWRGDWYRWSATCGHYAATSSEQIESSLYRDLRLGRRQDVGDVRHALIAVDDVLIDDAELGSWLGGAIDANPRDVAACSNGLLHLPTRALQPATPRYFSTTALAVAYDAAAPTPERWLDFLERLWPGDLESIAALQEWFGYLLTPDTRQQKILLLVGPKRSGKGTIMRVLIALLGAASVASPSLASLGNNFGLWPLIGKSAAIVQDARLGGRSDIAQIVERLLSVSGQDAQTIDRKHREPWTGYLSSRIAIVSNELPRFTDASDALASRMLILELARSWFGEEDTGLLDALLVELQGILLWAIDGWQRLNERGRFVQPAKSADTIIELADLASPVAAWARETCNVVADGRLPCGEAYADYKSWCGRNGQDHVVTLTTFGRDLKAATGARRERLAFGSRPYVYVGLEMK